MIQKIWHILLLLASFYASEMKAQQAFDHSVTGFPLRGAHAQIRCEDCHKQSAGANGSANTQWTGLKKDCFPCHNDYHGYKSEISAKQGPLLLCETCHNEVKWKDSLRFDHGTDTIYPLSGKHKESQCFDCHRPLTAKQAFKGLTAPKLQATEATPRRYFFKELTKKNCETCHVTVHKPGFHRKFKNVPCEKCHSTESWQIMNLEGEIQSDRNFHSKTRFALSGKHKEIACKECHVRDGKEIFKFSNSDQDFCVSCHASVHKKQFDDKFFNMSCAKCHTTVNFTKLSVFDHAITNFKIDGKHEKIANKCEKCHVATKDKLPTKPPKVAHLYNFDENKDENYCVNCHSTVHKEQLHPESLKKSCGVCHLTSGFNKLADFNHDTTRFKLTGKHDEIGKKCNECHKPSDIILPTKPPRRGNQFMFEGANRGFCEGCHKNEHKDMFRSKFANKPCGSCHVTERFTKLKDFDHDETDYVLKGKHKKVECNECHVNTNEKYKWKPQNYKGQYQFPDLEKRNCQSCHKDVHKGANGPNCSKCHNETGWKNAAEYHKDFQLTGVHLQLDCKKCHVNERVLHGSSQECSVCHHQEDVHQSALPNCQECHTQNFWQQSRFDHNLSRFPLIGAHRVTECRACHAQGVYQGQPTECRDCHFRDAAQVTAPDHSQPNFFQCEQCHTSYSFSGGTAR